MNLENFFIPHPEVEVFSPGRINFIGEHTDYNNGFVLPCAIDKKIHFKFSRNNSEEECNIYSHTYGESFQLNLNHYSKSKNQWENYLLGVIDEIRKAGKIIKGFNCEIKSDIPVGAGISSSAALECGFASGINALFDLGLPKRDIVELSQRAENIFVGSNCGIMDQFASVMSKKDHLILLDCQSMKSEYIPADLKGYKILLLNSNVVHNHAESGYNTRRYECEEAVGIIQEKYPEVRSLRDINFQMLAEFTNTLPKQIYQRSLYILEENQRVLKAAEAIKSGDLKQFGNLMYQSHEGMKTQYEISCPEIDFLVDFSLGFEYIIGSRMMGGGFGGCTINLIKEENVEGYSELISEAYYKKFGIKLDAFAVLPDQGTVVLQN